MPLYTDAPSLRECDWVALHPLVREPIGAYKGVSRPRCAEGKWIDRVSIKNGKQYHVGRFDDEAEAARAYLRAWDLIKAGKAERGMKSLLLHRPAS